MKGIDCKDLPDNGHNRVTELCKFNCVWGAYGEWSECNKEGEQERRRVPAITAKNGGKSCNTTWDACETRKCKVDCKWGEWEEYGECKDGVKRRFRKKGNQ